jgi:CRISPR-associated protein Cas2
MFVVVTYDITDDRRRLHVSDELENFGARVNYSVFECRLDPDHLADLKQRLAEKIEPTEDNVRYYTLCDACVRKVEVQGKGQVTRDAGYTVV